LPRDRAHDAEEQNRSRSIKWAAKQEKFQPQGDLFFLDFSLYRTYQLRKNSGYLLGGPISAFTEEAGCQNLC
jgi:hypothetical protein